MKDDSILHVLRIPEISELGWTVGDLWEGDLTAIGLVNAGRTRLAYVASDRDRPGRYYVNFSADTEEPPTDVDDVTVEDCDEAVMLDFFRLES